jgi:hypothetical protein
MVCARLQRLLLALTVLQVDASRVGDRPGSSARSRPGAPQSVLNQKRPGGLGGPDGLTAAERERQILELSWQLQRDATVVRMRSHATSVLRRWWAAQPRVVLVANRLPLTVKRKEDGSLEYSITGGGMVSALLGVRDVRMIWVGWAELSFDDPTQAEKAAIRRALWARGCVPVFLEKGEAELYYNGYCNGVLWPLFHYVVPSAPDETSATSEQAQWEAYRSVNARFAAVVESIVRKGDMVWAHDYHLMLLPSMLRQRLPDLRIGWFLHTPWPSSEVFRTAPMRKEVGSCCPSPAHLPLHCSPQPSTPICPRRSRMPSFTASHHLRRVALRQWKASGMLLARVRCVDCAPMTMIAITM